MARLTTEEQRKKQRRRYAEFLKEEERLSSSEKMTSILRRIEELTDKYYKDLDSLKNERIAIATEIRAELAVKFPDYHMYGRFGILKKETENG